MQNEAELLAKIAKYKESCIFFSRNTIGKKQRTKKYTDPKCSMKIGGIKLARLYDAAEPEPCKHDVGIGCCWAEEYIFRFQVCWNVISQRVIINYLG